MFTIKVEHKYNGSMPHIPCTPRGCMIIFKDVIIFEPYMNVLDSFQFLHHRWTNEDINYLATNILTALTTIHDDEWDSIELFFTLHITGSDFLEQFVDLHHTNLLHCLLPPSQVDSRYHYHYGLDEDSPHYQLQEVHITII